MRNSCRILYNTLSTGSLQNQGWQNGKNRNENRKNRNFLPERNRNGTEKLEWEFRSEEQNENRNEIKLFEAEQNRNGTEKIPVFHFVPAHFFQRPKLTKKMKNIKNFVSEKKNFVPERKNFVPE